MSTAPSKQYYYPRADAAQLANIPHELTKRKSWVVWDEAPNGTNPKYKKMPKNPLTLNGSDWNNPENWGERAHAVQIFERNPTLRGIGFVFSDNDPYAFFDLDGVIEKGKLLPWAAEFISMANSYTEISPSGTGVKIIVRAAVGARKKTFEFTDANGKQHELEVYDCDRFFAATGQRWEDAPRNIADAQELLDTLHPPVEDEEPGSPLDRTMDAYAEDVDAVPDDKLLDKIRSSSQGKKFQRLMIGNKTGYAGNFAASGALCSILAFWTRANPERIDKLFRKSKLFVDWWWEQKSYSGKRSRSQYVIEAACKTAASRPMYVPPASGLIVNDDGKVRAILANAITMLKTVPCWQDVLAYNELTLLPVKLKPAPWETHTGITSWMDHDDTKLAEWFERHGLFIDSGKKAGEAAQAVAREHSFHPVRDYLDSLKWNGKRRLNTWLSRYLGASDSRFVRAAGRCWLLSGVARIYRPGCKVDYVLTLEGDQGRLKSTALNTLAGDEFFLDDFAEVNDKDQLLKMHGAWIVEMAELTGARRDVNRVKAFLTCRDDVFRAPYDRRPQHHLRTNIFAASTNDDTWLADETGGRRFWPVKCGKIDIEKLREDRDQLWAEAVARFRKDEEWWFVKSELDASAEEEQRKRYQSGHWDEVIERWLENPVQRKEFISGTDKDGGGGAWRYVYPWDSTQDAVTVSDILLHAINKPVDRWTHADRHSVVRYLKSNNWERVSIRDGKQVRRIYRRSGVSGVTDI